MVRPCLLVQFFRVLALAPCPWCRLALEGRESHCPRETMIPVCLGSVSFLLCLEFIFVSQTESTLYLVSSPWPHSGCQLLLAVTFLLVTLAGLRTRCASVFQGDRYP